MKTLKDIGTVPFDLSVLQSFYPDCKHITDKVIRLEEDCTIVRLKKGLYVANTDDGTLSHELLANHIYGPSYVSMSAKNGRYPPTQNGDIRSLLGLFRQKSLQN